VTAPTIPSSPGGFRAFRDMRVGGKIYLAVVLVIVIVIVIAVAVGVGVLSVVRMGSLNDRLSAIKSQNVDGLRYVDVARGGIEQMYADLAGYFASTARNPDPATYLAKVRIDDKIIDDAIAAYREARNGGNEAAVQAFDAATTADLATLSDELRGLVSRFRY
jgi:cytochrome c-type biogenesis protein CcmH/NrfG